MGFVIINAAKQNLKKKSKKIKQKVHTAKHQCNSSAPILVRTRRGSEGGGKELICMNEKHGGKKSD